MNRMQFYLCKNCGNIITSTGISEISCCGRKLEASVAKPEEGEHKATITEIENDYYITLDHEMNKTHYITFVAYVMCDKVLFTKLYPEQGAEIRIPKIQQGKLYFACNQHGLWVKGSRT